MKRKVVKLGPSTLVVSLPSKWVKENKVKAGSEVEIIENENSLLFRPNKLQKKETMIKLENEHRKHYVYTALSHIYRMGFDKIRVEFEDVKTIRTIQRVVQDNLLGFEITKREEDYCILENITEPTEQKFPILLRRIFLQIKETHQLIIEDFDTNEKDNWEDLKALRSSLDRHIFFCRRSISKQVDLDHSNLLWELLTFLMHIQHAYYYMYEDYYGKKQKIHPKTQRIVQELEPYYNNYYKSFFEKNVSLLTKNQLEKKRLQEEINTQLEGKNPNKTILAHLQQIVRLIQIGGSPIRALLS